MVDPTAGIGSVADWVSGIGTLAAVVFAVYLYRSDLKEKRNKHAENVVCNLEVALTHHPEKETETFVVTASLINTGVAPIASAYLIGPKDMHSVSTPKLTVWHASTGPSVMGGRNNAVIQPGETGTGWLEYADEPSRSTFLVAFQDAAGNYWFREIDKKRYISKSKAFSAYKTIENAPVPF